MSDIKHRPIKPYADGNDWVTVQSDSAGLGEEKRVKGGLVSSFDSIADIPANFEGVARVGSQLHVGDGNGLITAGRILLELPVILPSSGSIANNGALTLSTALPDTYPDCWMYFPAGAIYSGSAAGMWYVRMTTTTTGNVYNHRNDGSVAPYLIETPAPLTSTGPGAYTQLSGVTASTATVALAKFPVKGGSLSKSARITAYPLWRYPANTNQKPTAVALNNVINSTNQANNNGASNTNTNAPVQIILKGQNRQITVPAGFSGGAGVSTALYESTEDTSLDFTVTFTGRLRDSALDYVVLESGHLDIV